MTKFISRFVHFLVFTCSVSSARRHQTGQTRLTVRESRVDDSNCKVFPGDTKWPSQDEWAALNASIGGVLLRPKPAAAVCYSGPDFNQTQCQFLVNGASRSRFWLDDPLTELAQWTQGSSVGDSMINVPR